MKDVWELLGWKSREALDRTKGLSPTPANLDRAAKEFGVEASRWAFDQWDLRRRARAKFERAEAMLFDREALEMATHERVAQMHAAQFPPKVRVADLTAGIGADLIALAREHKVVGYEVDPVRAAMARHNLQVHGLDADVQPVDCLDTEWDFDFAFADPARRSGGRRAVRAEDYQPPLPSLSERMSGLAIGFIKVSPMLRDEELRASSGQVEFWSFEGECREAVLRVGREFEGKESMRAFQVESGQWLSGSERSDFEPESLDEPLEYVFEADPAAIRAHALPALCQHLGAHLLGDSNGYLTASFLARDPKITAFSRAFRVVAGGSADLKRIRVSLRKLDARVSVVKLRAVREDPSQWMARLKSNANREVVLMLYPVGKSVRYLLAEPQ